jgi:hypothetical protein
LDDAFGHAVAIVIELHQRGAGWAMACHLANDSGIGRSMVGWIARVV